MSHNSLYLIYRNFPDPEKTEDMIDTRSIKIARHLLQAFIPPRKIVIRHFLPIIGWEPPVLTKICKLIGWRSCLLVEIKQFGTSPCFNTIGTYANRNITL